jgi:YhcH/YjgK/YiaL family protein
MILSPLSQADRYIALHPGFAAAFSFLQRRELNQLPDGRNEIDGQRLYAMVMRVPGKGCANTKLEVHRRYIDIQYCVAKGDLIGWKPTATCSKADLPYDDAKDFQLFADQPDDWVATAPGTFAIFFPEDAHAPLGGEGPIHKVVVKVAADWK